MRRNLTKKLKSKPKRQHKKGPKANGSLCDDNETVAQKSEDVKFIDKLIDKAESLMDCFEYEAAHKFCQRALDLEPNNLRVLETSASLMLDVDEVNTAIICLKKAVELSPDSGHTKYLTLGQIYEGIEAVNVYKQGINIMQNQLEKLSSEASASPDVDELKNDLSSVHCSVAEIYMSDCCFEENAESECKHHIDKAIEVDPSNPEVYLVSANFLMVQDKKDEAKEAVLKCLSLWLPNLQEIHEGTITNSEYDSVNVCSFSYDSRINTSKILIELEMYNESSDVLESLLEENDEVVEVWHLLGWTNYLHGADYKNNARFYLKKAAEVAKKVKFDDEDLMKHVYELLEELGPETEDNEAEGEDEDWEDVSDDEENGEDSRMETL